MLSNNILIVDDEVKLRNLMARLIRLEGLCVLEAGDLSTAEKMMEKEGVEVLLCDVKLPDGNGVAFVRNVKKKHPGMEVILLTAYGNIADGIQAMKNGAFDYIIKGDDNDKVIPLIHKALEKAALQKRVNELETQVGKRYSFESLIGNSAALQQAVSLAVKVAATDTTVMLLGETGTGKEVFAQAIHHAGSRSNKSFMALNCSAFSKELLESEVFGHKAGAFTGAAKDKKGLIEEANGGTLFLDEIGEMHLDLQSKFLRVLETSEFIKVGDTKSTKVNVRIIAATNRNMDQEVQEGKFREDLFYRLNVFAIRLPALRERKEDIPLLAENFVAVFARRSNKRLTGMHTLFVDRLQQHHWRGNIRELKNVIERSVILADGPQLTIDTLPLELQLPEGNPALASFDLATIEKMHIRKVVQHTKGNKTKAAELLGIGLTTLYRKMEEYNISIT